VEDLKRCVTSILEKSTYDNYEIVIVENNSTTREIKDYYAELVMDAYEGFFEFLEENGSSFYGEIDSWNETLKKGFESVNDVTLNYYNWTMTDPQKDGATFEGWLEFTMEKVEDGWGYTNYVLVSENLLTTDQVINKKPTTNTTYAAKWSDVEISDYYKTEEEELIFEVELLGNGGKLSVSQTGEDGTVTEVLGNRMRYELLGGTTLKSVIDAHTIKVLGALKDCAEAKTWTLYSYAERESVWVENPGDTVTAEDGQMVIYGGVSGTDFYVVYTG